MYIHINTCTRHIVRVHVSRFHFCFFFSNTFLLISRYKLLAYFSHPGLNIQRGLFVNRSIFSLYRVRVNVPDNVHTYRRISLYVYTAQNAYMYIHNTFWLQFAKYVMSFQQTLAVTPILRADNILRRFCPIRHHFLVFLHVEYSKRTII